MKPLEVSILQEIKDQMALKVTLKILELLILNPKMIIPELAQQIDKSKRTIKRMLKKLQKEGYLKRIGSDKGGHWKVIDKKTFAKE